MSLVRGYEMGVALLAAKNPNEAWQTALEKETQSKGPQLHLNVAQIEKGAFPDKLSVLRAQLSLQASGDDPVALVVECGPNVLTLIANDITSTHGVWNVNEAQFYPLKAEEMYGTKLIELLRKQLVGGDAFWVAYFLSSPSAAATPAPAAQPKKKQPAARKRPLLVEPTITDAAVKKTALIEQEEETGTEAQIN
jgi:hypothetical protein